MGTGRRARVASATVGQITYSWECYGCGQRVNRLGAGWATRCPACGSYELRLADDMRPAQWGDA